MDDSNTGESKPIVFVTQIPTKRDNATGMLIPTVNIAPATEHGEIKTLLPSSINFFATADLIRQLKESLKDYSFARGDSIIALGDPVIIAACCAIIARNNSRFYLCKWDRVITRYLKIEINV
jgi:hypothetical protein